MRRQKGLTLRELGEKVGVSYAYVSKVENGKLDFGDSPSEDLICRLAAALGADEEELLLSAGKIPEAIRRRFLQRPDVFRRIARLSDRRLDRLLAALGADRDGHADRPTTGPRGPGSPHKARRPGAGTHERPSAE